MPEPLELLHLSQGSESEVAELRNHVVVSEWVAKSAVQKRGTCGLSEQELRDLAAIMIKGTESEKLHTHGWGKRTKPGEYRLIPIRVKTNPLRIFPYHFELPTLMKNFFHWRNNTHLLKAVHPLIHACHSFIYFVFLHSFVDGNGRVGRTLFHDYLIRQGFLPIIMQELDRQPYLRLVSDAEDGYPEGFNEKILLTQLDMLRKFKGVPES
jgi:Fic family protein